MRRRLAWKLARKGIFRESSAIMQACSGARIYCQESKCMDRKIHELHLRVLAGECSEQEIDRYITTCIFLRSLHRAGRTRAADSDSSTARITLRCVCGDPEHDLVICKKNYRRQFPTLLKPEHVCASKSRRRRRDAKARNREIAQQHQGGRDRQHPLGVQISMADLVAPLPLVVGVASLPDTGVFLRAVLEKRFFSSNLEKHNSKCVSDMEDKTAKRSPAEASSSSNNKSLMWTLTEHACSILIQESIMCLKRSKKTHKSPQLPEDVAGEEIDICLRIMFGTLLKLYPLGAKRPIFNARVNISERLAALLLMEDREKRAFVVQNVSLLKICFIEHTVNMLQAYLPCERALFLSSSPTMSLFESLAVTMCDGFRQETVVTGLESWKDMDRFASIRIDRCMRMCRLKMTKTPDPVVKHNVPPAAFCRSAFDMLGTMGDASAAKILYPAAPPDEISFACKLQKCISCHPLPLQVCSLQQEALVQLHSSCYRRFYAAHNLHFCTMCAMNGRGLRSKLRMCITTGSLQCDACPPGTVLSVNMLGCILKVCNTSYYICPCCTKLQVWRGDGTDLLPVLSTMIQQERDEIRLKNYTAEEACCFCSDRVHPPPQPRCMVCSARNTGKPLTTLPDLASHTMVRCYLCMRHSLPDHVTRNIHNISDLRKALSKGVRVSLHRRPPSSSVRRNHKNGN